jgi:hypothetical protein
VLQRRTAVVDRREISLNGNHLYTLGELIDIAESPRSLCRTFIMGLPCSLAQQARRGERTLKCGGINWREVLMLSEIANDTEFYGLE